MKMPKSLIKQYEMEKQDGLYAVQGLLKDFSYHALANEDDISEVLAFLNGKQVFSQSGIISGSSRDDGNPLEYCFIRLDKLYIIFESEMGVSTNLEEGKEIPAFSVSVMDSATDTLFVREIKTTPTSAVMKKLTAIFRTESDEMGDLMEIDYLATDAENENGDDFDEDDDFGLPSCTDGCSDPNTYDDF